MNVKTNFNFWRTTFVNHSAVAVIEGRLTALNTTKEFKWHKSQDSQCWRNTFALQEQTREMICSKEKVVSVSGSWWSLKVVGRNKAQEFIPFKKIFASHTHSLTFTLFPLTLSNSHSHLLILTPSHFYSYKNVLILTGFHSYLLTPSHMLTGPWCNCTYCTIDSYTWLTYTPTHNLQSVTHTDTLILLPSLPGTLFYLFIHTLKLRFSLTFTLIDTLQHTHTHSLNPIHSQPLTNINTHREITFFFTYLA